MAYTVLSLINQAYFASGIVSFEFEDVGGPEQAQGLQFLNELISEKTTTKSAIPYFTSYTFNSIIGQEQYSIPDLIEITSMTFVIATVRYCMTQKQRNSYFGDPRANNIETLPFTFECERTLQGADIYMYPLPNDVYPVTLWGKFRLQEVTINQNLLLTLNRFYIKYLRYQLIRVLCAEYNYDIPAGVVSILAECENYIKKISGKIDTSMTKISTLNTVPNAINYAQINIGRGWTAG